MQVKPLQPMGHTGGADMRQTAAHGGSQAGGSAYVIKEVSAQVEPTRSRFDGRSYGL